MTATGIARSTIALWIMLIAAGTLAADRSRGSRKPENWSQRKDISFEQLQQNFERPDMIYAPFAFWFWDAPLDERLASDMAAEMSRQRMNPGYVHARNGLPHEQWLSPSWFESFEAALKNAEAADSYLGFCDEYWWPSGQADGRVLEAHPELAAVSLKWDTRDVAGGAGVHLPESFFTVAAKMDEPDAPNTRIVSSSLTLIGSGEAFDWRAPVGKWRVYSFSKYHQPGWDGGKVNYLDRRLADIFVSLAHEPYANRFGDRMGKSIPGVFVDHEGDYGRKLAWSNDLEREYKDRKSADIRLNMPLLVDEDIEGRFAKARWDWYDVVSDIYADGFLSGVSRWLEKRGMYCISNLWEETLTAQAHCVGDFFKAQRAVSFPGTDALSGPAGKAFIDLPASRGMTHKALLAHDFAETQSVAEFENRRFMCEILGVAGWQLSPVTMKQVANAVTARGVDHVVLHGVNLNRKLNTVPFPPDFFIENPYWRYFHLWTDFVRRASYVNSHGHLAPDVLLLNPMDSVWALLGEGFLDERSGVSWPQVFGANSSRLTRRGDRIDHIESVYGHAIDDLDAARIEFMVADRYYLRRMKLEPDGRLVTGPFQFKALILPDLFVLPLDVATKIVDFAVTGGRVYLLGGLPEGSTDNGANDPKMRALMARLRDLPSVTQAGGGVAELVAEKSPYMVSQVVFESGEFPMLQLHRRIDHRDLFWLVNNTGDRQVCTLTVRNARGLASIWNCETGQIANISSRPNDEGSRVNLTFEPYEAYWLVFDSIGQPMQSDQLPRESWSTAVTLDDSWNVRIDESVQPPPVSIRSTTSGAEGLVSPEGENRPLADWGEWGLKMFSGFVDYATTFELGSEDGRVMLCLGKVEHMAEVWVNGKAVGYRLWPPFDLEITAAVRPGENELKIRVGNLICNSMKQFVDDSQSYEGRLLVPVWAWSLPTAKDFEAGLLGPVEVKRLDRAK